MTALTPEVLAKWKRWMIIWENKAGESNRFRQSCRQMLAAEMFQHRRALIAAAEAWLEKKEDDDE